MNSKNTVKVIAINRFFIVSNFFKLNHSLFLGL